MPIIARFFGIIVYMYWREHDPPHFHVKHGNNEIIVEIETGKITGKISKRVISMVQEWRELHKEELMADWKLAKQMKPLTQITPLE